MTITLTRIISSFFYLGYLPFSASLTSLVAIIVSIFLSNQIVWIIFFTLIGVVTSNHFSKITNQSDPKYITIDEFVGQLISLYLITPTPLNLLLGFLFFRFYDLTKPSIIRQSQKLPGGLGIMADDILAGIFANLTLRLFIFIL